MDGMQPAPQHELPKPQAPIGEVGVGKGEFGHVTPELKVAPIPGEQLVQANNAVAQAASAVPTIPLQQFQGVNTSLAPQTTNPVIADDNDVIEKEWVDKAKDIVIRTQGDPHAKSKELTGLKKEYIQKRYGKTIATPSDEANVA